MKIVVHIEDAQQWQNALAQAFPDAQITTSDAPPPARANADYLAVWKPSESLLREQTRLKAIINLGAGVDYLLQTPGLPDDVPVVKLRDAGMGELMADYVRYGVLHFQRSFDRYLAQQPKAHWLTHEVPDKADWPVGILGLGAIGTHVAKALSGDGFPVLGWSRSPKQIDGVSCYHGEEGLADVLRQAQTLVTLLPDTAATRGLINAERLALLPDGASLINPGRGTLLDHDALLSALGDSGHLRGALLDVFAEEPLPEFSPLWQHPKVIVTPHMSAPTPLNEAIDQVIDTLRAFEAGEPVATVNRQAGY
ncbi:MAG: glyoxylate/hydroxypyruvate reductase A [Halomonas sp.]|nr:glyoxylate/hydroxypyruvate reductase A [Halomonas sp.]TVM04888.1 MAG: glyoxylate/hydroxypyruvate reductase A [Halomonas sp.]